MTTRVISIIPFGIAFSAACYFFGCAHPSLSPQGNDLKVENYERDLGISSSKGASFSVSLGADSVVKVKLSSGDIVCIPRRFPTRVMVKNYVILLNTNGMALINLQRILAYRPLQIARGEQIIDVPANHQFSFRTGTLGKTYSPHEQFESPP